MKNILIIGGTTGIGLQLARTISSNYRVMVVARNESHELPSGVSFYKTDVTKEAFTYEGDELHGLVYCPGSITLKPFERLKEQDFANDFQLNTMGAVRQIQANLPKLKKAAHASVILFSTVAVSQGMPFHASVAAAKGAVEGLGRSLAAELAPSIRVNVIAPSITDTPLAKRILSSEEKKKNSARRHALNRVGEPGDIASMAEFLLSEKSSWITGQVMAVDGGMSAVRQL